MASLCHLWFTTTNLSYRFPIFETSATALCGTTGRDYESSMCIICRYYLILRMSELAITSPCQARHLSVEERILRLLRHWQPGLRGEKRCMPRVPHVPRKKSSKWPKSWQKSSSWRPSWKNRDWQRSESLNVSRSERQGFQTNSGFPWQTRLART